MYKKTFLQRVFCQRSLALAAARLVEKSDRLADPHMLAWDPSKQATTSLCQKGENTMDFILRTYVQKDIAFKLSLRQ